MDSLNLIQKIAIFALPAIFAITLHEAAHGWVASKLGDRTALMLGRVTLNPLKHIDPVGTILVPLVTMFTGFIFGWAKPVPVNFKNLHHERRDSALVALAGPMANLVMAIFWALMIKLGVLLLAETRWVAVPLIYMGGAGVLINIILMVLNLTPVLPLDGGRVISALLPPRAALVYSRLEPYGLLIIILLLVTGVLGRLLWPLALFIINLLPASHIVLQLFLH